MGHSGHSLTFLTCITSLGVYLDLPKSIMRLRMVLILIPSNISHPSHNPDWMCTVLSTFPLRDAPLWPFWAPAFFFFFCVSAATVLGSSQFFAPYTRPRHVGIHAGSFFARVLFFLLLHCHHHNLFTHTIITIVHPILVYPQLTLHTLNDLLLFCNLVIFFGQFFDQSRYYVLEYLIDT